MHTKCIYFRTVYGIDYTTTKETKVKISLYDDKDAVVHLRFCCVHVRQHLKHGVALLDTVLWHVLCGGIRIIIIGFIGIASINTHRHRSVGCLIQLR